MKTCRKSAREKLIGWPKSPPLLFCYSCSEAALKRAGDTSLRHTRKRASMSADPGVIIQKADEQLHPYYDARRGATWHDPGVVVVYHARKAW